MKVNDAQSRNLVTMCCRALDAKKAGNVRVLDVREVSSITNYLIIATATSEPHVRALRVELEKVLDAARAHIVGVETARESGWTVMDAFDVMIHVFAPEVRSRFGLEKLWKDAHEVPLGDLLAPKARPARRAAKPAKKPLASKKRASRGRKSA
jgi:ribosome-associated protein